MPDFNINAIVIRRSVYGETDNILTLYSRERGRLSAIAKGARKAISRLSGPCEVLCHSRFLLASARTLQVVRQAEIVTSYPPLRDDLLRLANGMYIADLLGAFVTDGDPNPTLFDLLESTLQLIAVVKRPTLAARWFEMRLLDEIGYAPQLSECVVCGANLFPPPPHPVALSASQGGLLCSVHSDPETHDDQVALDMMSLRIIQTLFENNTLPELYENGILENDRLNDRPVASALRKYIHFRIDRVLKSVEFLDSVIGGF